MGGREWYLTVIYIVSLVFKMNIVPGVRISQQQHEAQHSWGYHIIYVTRSRKRGPFPKKSDCELDLLADSAKSVVQA